MSVVTPSPVGIDFLDQFKSDLHSTFELGERSIINFSSHSHFLETRSIDSLLEHTLPYHYCTSSLEDYSA